MTRGRTLWLCAAFLALVVFAAPTPFWLCVLALILVPLLHDLHSDWRRETEDLRTLRRNQTLRKGQQ